MPGKNPAQSPVTADDVKTVWSDNEGIRRGDDAPGDHDARNPAPGAIPIQDQIARDFKDAVAGEQQPGAPAKLIRRQAEVVIHRQCGKANTGPVQVVENIGYGEKRQEPPGDFR